MLYQLSYDRHIFICHSLCTNEDGTTFMSA